MLLETMLPSMSPQDGERAECGQSLLKHRDTRMSSSAAQRHHVVAINQAFGEECSAYLFVFVFSTFVSNVRYSKIGGFLSIP